MPTKFKKKCNVRFKSNLFRDKHPPFRNGRIMQALINETCCSKRASGKGMTCLGDTAIGSINDMSIIPHAELVVEFGDKGAPNTVIKYFALSCKECVRFIREDFPLIQEKYIASGQLQWTFRPLLTDFLTLRLAAFFEGLSAEERRHFICNLPPIAHCSSPHTEEMRLESYFMEQRISKSYWIKRGAGHLIGRQAERDFKTFWKSQLYPKLFNYFVLCGDESHSVYQEPTYEAIASLLDPLCPRDREVKV